MQAAWSLLTSERLALLRAIRARHPGSMAELARTVGRPLKELRRDLRTLGQYGLIRKSPGRHADTRRVPRLEVPLDGIVLKIAL